MATIKDLVKQLAECIVRAANVNSGRGDVLLRDIPPALLDEIADAFTGAVREIARDVVFEIQRDQDPERGPDEY